MRQPVIINAGHHVVPRLIVTQINYIELRHGGIGAVICRVDPHKVLQSGTPQRGVCLADRGQICRAGITVRRGIWSVR
ncbi:hypothetical protein ACJ3XI_10135 [Litorimonas sp. RW-G-Af-16]